ncbi:MAG: carboxypeptidase-like regulatory domain-containing protein, partial [Flavobacteriaceae bacterium]
TKTTSKKEFVSLEIGSLKNSNSTKLQITTIGKITDENGKPLFNVEILVKESEASELSGLKGDYKIISVNDVTLIFRKNGFISQEVIIERKSEIINIALKKEVKNTKIELKGKVHLVEKSIDSISVNKPETTKINIKGTITDNNGFPLPGVNIIIKGTTVGTQTDFDGNYELISDKNKIIVYSYIGFETEEITLSNINNDIDLSMKEDEAILGEMIVMGYSLGFEYSDYDPNKPHWRETTQTSLDNEKEFSRIKRERKKEAKRLKREKK